MCEQSIFRLTIVRICVGNCWLMAVIKLGGRCECRPIIFHCSIIYVLKSEQWNNRAARDDGCIKLGRRVGHQLQRKTAINRQSNINIEGQRWWVDASCYEVPILLYVLADFPWSTSQKYVSHKWDGSRKNWVVLSYLSTTLREISKAWYRYNTPTAQETNSCIISFNSVEILWNKM